MNPSTECAGNITDCKTIQQTIQLLQFYQSGPTALKLVGYVEKNSISILNVYHHILLHDLQSVNEYIVQNNHLHCDFNQCPCVRRRRQRDDDQKTNDDDDETNQQYIFYRNMMDQIHDYLMHTFDAGMRTKRIDKKIDMNEKKDDNINDEDGHIFDDYKQSINDKELAMILEKNKSIQHNDDNHDKKNKFDITASMDNTIGDKADKPFIHWMLDQIANSNPDNMKETEILYAFLMEQEYDSDAVNDDIPIDGDIKSERESNIMNHMEGVAILDSVKYHIKNDMYLSKYGVFRNSFALYYWDYYKNNDNKSDARQLNNEQYHLYTYGELYVAAKFQNLKAEIINNTIKALPLQQYMKALYKAEAMLNTQKAKNLKSQEAERVFHFGIKSGEAITLQHILSIILYTDYTELCTQFRATFRSKTGYESLEAVKKRNSMFANWSKGLRECIDSFGMRMEERGPLDPDPVFYTGMNATLLMESFSIYLYSPTSTTSEFSVATNFAKRTGIIIELTQSPTRKAGKLRYFNVVWLSGYPQESEKTFFGGKYPLQLSTIRIVNTRQNFEIFIQTLFKLEIMINGAAPIKTMEKAKERDNYIIKALIDSKINNEPYKFEEYVHSSFIFACDKRRQIIIHFKVINAFFTKIKEILFSKGNILNLQKIAKIYPNVEMISIKDDPANNQFDLAIFVEACVNIINGCNKISVIKVSAQREVVGDEYEPTWLHKQYEMLLNNKNTVLKDIDVSFKIDDVMAVDIVLIKRAY